MTALAVDEVICNKTSEFLTKNSESSETSTDNMKLAMAVDDDAMADTIETSDLSNGYSDLINEKSCKENYIPDTLQSEASQYDTSRSEHSSTLMEDAEDNFSITLRLSDDDEDAEIETTEKGTEENIDKSNNENELKNENEDQLNNVETENKNNAPEIVDKIETIIPVNSKIESQNKSSVNDILTDIDNCLSEENNSNLDNLNTIDINKNQGGLNESINEQHNVNEKDETHSDFQISNVLTEENCEKEIKLPTEENLNVDIQELSKINEESQLEDNGNKIINNETKESEENSSHEVILNKNHLNKDLDITNKINEEVENQEKTIDNSQSTTLIKDSECNEKLSNSRRNSETFKRKIDEPIVKCNELKKIKIDSTISKINDCSKFDKEDTSHTQIKEDDADIKSDDDKINLKDEKKAEIKKKLILRVLPLLFENEQIPNVNVEELILTKIIEGITLRTELAALRQKAQSQEQIIDQLRRKATHLSKQLEDISTVTNRLTVDLQHKDRPVAPVKITRSVGLQVAIPTTVGKRYSTHSMNSSSTTKKRLVSNNNTNTNSSATNNSQPNVNPTNVPTKTVASVNNNTNSTKSPSLLNKALTKPTTLPRNTTLVVHPTTTKSQSETPVKQNKEKVSSENRPVTVDLTDEDLDSNKNNGNSVVSQNPPSLIPLTPGNLRMVSSLGNTMSTTSSTNQAQRVTYLMAAPAGPGQNRLLIATSATPTGPRPALTVVGQPNVRGAQGTQGVQRYLVNTTNGQQAIVQRPGIVLTNGQTPNTVRTVPVRVNNNNSRTNALTNVSSRPLNPTLHPAPLPILLNQPHLPTWRQIPPRPSLKISRTKDGGIQLSWSMPELDQKIHEEVASYQLYAYQEGSAPPSTDLWRKVGDVKALPLPMACTLTSFHPGNKYYFAVRAIDVHSRVSQFSYAQPISLHN